MVQRFSLLRVWCLVAALLAAAPITQLGVGHGCTAECGRCETPEAPAPGCRCGVSAVHEASTSVPASAFMPQCRCASRVASTLPPATTPVATTTIITVGMPMVSASESPALALTARAPAVPAPARAPPPCGSPAPVVLRC